MLHVSMDCRVKPGNDEFRSPQKCEHFRAATFCSRSPLSLSHSHQHRPKPS
jgi:hypothetical protein